jgi:hypothetical protein
MIDEGQGSSVSQVVVPVTSWACVTCGRANPGHESISIAIPICILFEGTE